MNSVQEHYDRHLGRFYAWSVGGLEHAMQLGDSELTALGVGATDGGLAVDLGAGFGAHAVPLARRGFDVVAIDSCAALLDELKATRGGLPILTVESELQSFQQRLPAKPDLVLCMGDTLNHLADRDSVERLIRSVAAELSAGGRFIVSLRDYSTPLTASKRFIPVRSDEHRILTCFLEYADSHLTVHDILYEKDGDGWKMGISTYRKLRLSIQWLKDRFRENGFSVEQQLTPSGMTCLVGQRRTHVD